MPESMPSPIVFQGGRLSGDDRAAVRLLRQPSRNILFTPGAVWEAAVRHRAAVPDAARFDDFFSVRRHILHYQT